MDKRSTLAAYLKEYTGTGVYPMHMPGHKRHVPGEIADLMSSIYGIDVTEVPATDDLHEATGILKSSMDHAAMIYGSKKSYYLVNGSSCGNLAAIYSIIGRGEQVLICEDSHRSVYHALETSGAIGIKIQRPIVDSLGIHGSIDPKQVRCLLEKDREHRIKAVHITSPTYDGVISDIKSISKVVHEYDMPLIVDEAHGAHLIYMKRAEKDMEPGSIMHTPSSAIECGADIVVQSLHKTLPALTQSAILHVCSDRIALDRLDHALDIFETSSPSYVLMSAMDACIRYMESDGMEDMKRYHRRLKGFYRDVGNLNAVRVWIPTQDTDSVYDWDSGKIVIYSDRLPAYTLANLLLERYMIDIERVTERHVLAMTSAWDTDEGFKILTEALRELDKDYQ